MGRREKPALSPLAQYRHKLDKIGNLFHFHFAIFQEFVVPLPALYHLKKQRSSQLEIPRQLEAQDNAKAQYLYDTRQGHQQIKDQFSVSVK